MSAGWSGTPLPGKPGLKDAKPAAAPGMPAGRRRLRGLLCAALLLPLAACGPMSVQNAEAMCFERARLASQPRGEVAAGISNGKPAGGFKIEISSDYLLRRDPSAVYDQCVLQKSGQAPSQPLYSRTDWKG